MPEVIVWDNELAPTLQPALDIHDAAKLFKCSHMTIRRMIADGRLPAVKVGARWRIRAEDAHAYLTGGAA